ncbi:MAG: dihydrodipicolinate reductase, partial [Desulfobacterales bacterium]
MTPISIMINGLPGNMAFVLAETALADSRFKVLPYSLTGPEIQATDTAVGSADLKLIPPDQRESAIPRVIQAQGPFICVDFTHPSAVNRNAEFYCAQELPFVMGTTGGERGKLYEVVENSGCSAVIAPNMAKQIVGFQAMIQYAAQSFPGLFAGYGLAIKESHQQGKADTSGTAKAMVDLFNQLGMDFNREEIVQERDPLRQESIWAVPAPFLKGHAWHTYT